MRLFEIQIPKTANLGDVKAFNLVHDQLGNFTKEHHAEFLAEVLKVSGGYSVLPEVIGVWVDNGEEYKEKMIPVRFALDGFDVLNLANFAKVHYKQFAIFVAEIGTARIYT